MAVPNQLGKEKPSIVSNHYLHTTMIRWLFFTNLRKMTLLLQKKVFGLYLAPHLPPIYVVPFFLPETFLKIDLKISNVFLCIFSIFFVVMHLVLIFQKSFFLYWQITAYLSKCKIITALFILYFASSPFLTKPPSPNDPLTAPLMCGRSAI